VITIGFQFRNLAIEASNALYTNGSCQSNGPEILGGENTIPAACFRCIMFNMGMLLIATLYSGPKVWRVLRTFPRCEWGAKCEIRGSAKGG
jgi:hypothetical protein